MFNLNSRGFCSCMASMIPNAYDLMFIGNFKYVNDLVWCFDDVWSEIEMTW